LGRRKDNVEKDVRWMPMGGQANVDDDDDDDDAIRQSTQVELSMYDDYNKCNFTK
jgi:hypothetical protein